MSSALFTRVSRGMGQKAPCWRSLELRHGCVRDFSDRLARYILRTSPFGHSANFVFKEFSEVCREAQPSSICSSVLTFQCAGGLRSGGSWVSLSPSFVSSNCFWVRKAAPERSAPESFVTQRIAPERSAPARNAPERFAQERSASGRFAQERSASGRFASERSASRRFASESFAPESIALEKLAPERSAP